jgi:hypothetical protein
MDSGYGGIDYFLCLPFVYFLIAFNYGFACLGVNHFSGGKASGNSIGKWRQYSFLFSFGYPDAVGSPAVILKCDDILGNVNQASGKITAV